MDNVNSRSDPYQLFLDSIRSSETLRRYKTHLHSFLKLIPNQIYIDSLGKTPKDREATTLAKSHEDNVQVLKVIKKELVPNCKHPKKMRDKTADGQWYCMNCNMDL